MIKLIKLIYLFLTNKKKFFNEFIKLIPFESLFEILKANEKYFFERLIAYIPKEAYVVALNERIENEKRIQIANMVKTIETQKQIVNSLAEYDKLLDLEKKEVGDKVIIWDFASATFFDTNESLLSSLTDEEKETIGELIVYETNVDHSTEVDIAGMKYNFLQNLLCYSKKYDKNIRINSVHVRLV